GMYDDSDPTRHPQVWVADDRAFIGWVGTNSRVLGPDTLTNTLMFGNGAVTNFAPLLTPDGAAVVWAEGTGIFAQHQDDPNPLSLADCPAIAGWQPLFLGGMGLAGPSNALTIAIWTKSNGTSFAAQARAVQCTADMCFLITQ